MEDNMKKFSLEEYLKNPNREVVTRDERKVRIICTDRKNHDSQPIIALVETDEDNEWVKSFKIDGKWSVDGLESDFDLFFAPTIVKRWGIVYIAKPSVFSTQGRKLRSGWKERTRVKKSFAPSVKSNGRNRYESVCNE